MSNFYDIYPPEFINNCIVGSTNFETQILKTFSGMEIRYAQNHCATQKYIVKNCHISQDELEIFNAFFRGCMGASIGFCLKDAMDYKAIKQKLHLKQKGNYDIFKQYCFAGKNYLRKITKLAKNSLKIEPSAITELLSIDYEKSLILLHENLEQESTILLDFEFDVPVRFAQDSFNYCFCNDGSILLDNIAMQEIIL